MRVMRVGSAYELSLHVKLPRELSLAEAHDVIERLEAAVRAAVPEMPQRAHAHRAARAHRLGLGAGRRTTRRSSAPRSRRRCAASPARCRRRCASATPSAAASRSSRSCCPASSRCPSAHRHAGRIEEAVRERCRSLADVIVHTEPEAARAPDGLSAG